MLDFNETVWSRRLRSTWIVVNTEKRGKVGPYLELCFQYFYQSLDNEGGQV